MYGRVSIDEIIFIIFPPFLIFSFFFFIFSYSSIYSYFFLAWFDFFKKFFPTSFHVSWWKYGECEVVLQYDYCQVHFARIDCAF